MKPFIILLIALLSGILSAQKTVSVKIVDKKIPKTTIVKEKINQYVSKIDSLVKAEKATMKKEIDAVDVLLSQKEITEQEAKSQKEAITHKYADRMDEKIAVYQAELEAIIEKQVEISVKDVNFEGLNITLDKTPKKISQIDMLVQLGFTNLLDGNNLNSMNQSDIGFGNSVAFAIGPRANWQPKLSSHFVYSTGIIFKWNNLKPDSNLIFIDNEDTTELIQPDFEIKKSKLRNSKIYIPLNVTYAFYKSHTTEDGTVVNNPNKNFRVGLGVYAGLNLNSKSIYKQKIDGDTQKIKIKDDFNMNKFFYGAEVSVGYNNYTFFIQKDFTDTFENYNYSTNQGIEFGVRLGF